MKRYYVVASDEDCAYAKGFDSMFKALGFFLKVQEGKKYQTVILMERFGDTLKIMLK